MDFYGIKMLGDIVVEKQASLNPIFGDFFEAHSLVLDQDTGILCYGDTNPSPGSFRNLVDIPKNSIFLFDSDTSIIGYAILTAIDDSVVYITSGSGTYGDSGGSNKTDGTWERGLHSHTLNNHTHTLSNHRHNMESHTHSTTQHHHKWIDYLDASNTQSWNNVGSPINLESYGSAQNSTCVGVLEHDNNTWAAIGDFYTSKVPLTSSQSSVMYTDYAADSLSSGNTDVTGTLSSSSTWRPYGRNVTRQMRL